MSYRSKGRKAGLEYTQHARGVLGQTAGTLEHNAKLQSAVNHGSASDAEYDASLSNPYKVHEGEKFDLLDAVRERVKTNLKVAVVRSIQERLEPGLAQIKALGGWGDTDTLLRGIRNELSGIIVKLGQTKVFGWKIQKIADSWALLARTISLHADSVARVEAPAVMLVGMAVSTEGHLVTTVADFKADLVKDELHRVADTFGLDAAVLTAIVKAAATLHSRGSLDLAAHGDATYSSGGATEIIAGTSLKISAPDIVFTNGTATIQMTGGITHINPLSPVAASSPTAVADPTLLAPIGKMRQKEMKPQYEKANGHATSVI